MLASVRGKLGVISMDAQFLLQLVQAAVVVIGVGFAAYELRKYREERNREAALELVHTFQTPEFAKALLIVCGLPDGLSQAEIEAHAGEDFYLVYGMVTTWESIGILVHRGEMSIDLVDDFFSGPILLSWRKLQGYFFDQRRETDRETWVSGSSGWRSGSPNGKPRRPRCPRICSSGTGDRVERCRPYLSTSTDRTPP